jgi:hypothetical protein
MGPDASQYWDAWSTSHLFYALGINESIFGRRGIGQGHNELGLRGTGGCFTPSWMDGSDGSSSSQ